MDFHPNYPHYPQYNPFVHPYDSRGESLWIPRSPGLHASVSSRSTLPEGKHQRPPEAVGEDLVEAYKVVPPSYNLVYNPH